MPNEHANSIDSDQVLLRARRRPLEVFVRPESVALVGASERPGSVGHRLVSNLLGNSIHRKIFLINPVRPTVLGNPCYQRLVDVPDHVDLAIIAVPAPMYPV